MIYHFDLCSDRISVCFHYFSLQDNGKISVIVDVIYYVLLHLYLRLVFMLIVIIISFNTSVYVGIVRRMRMAWRDLEEG